MRQGVGKEIGEEFGHGFSGLLTHARRQLVEADLVGALRTVRNEVLPLAEKLRARRGRR